MRVLNTKKSILEYIAEAQKLGKEGIDPDRMAEIYKEIYDAIEAMSSNVKANTIVFLKNELKKGIGKYQPVDPDKKEDYFMEFFKEAYPEGKRRKEYTYTLVDPSKITVDQILHTLKYIDGYCKNNRISQDQKKSIIPMIERIARTDSLKHINQVRSMEYLRKAVRVRIEKSPKGHIVTRC